MEQKQSQSKEKANKVEPPVKVEEQPQPASAELLPGILAGSGTPDDILQRQCELLGDRRLDCQQRQKMAAQIGRVQGNKQLQRLMLKIETRPGAGSISTFSPPSIQRDLPNKSEPVSSATGPGTAPQTREERREGIRESDDPVEAAQASERARLSEWALENWIRGERNLRVTVPAEEGHSEEGPRVLEWRTLFLGAGREAFAITEDPGDPDQFSTG